MYAVRPFRFVPGGNGVSIEYLNLNEFSVTMANQSGSMETRREDVQVNIHTWADGLDFDLTEGPYVGTGGPENWDDLTFAMIAPEVQTENLNRP